MTITDSQKGNIYIISEMIIWSLFPIISLLGLSGLASLVSLFWVNIFSTIFFLIIVIFRGNFSDFWDRKVWLYSLGAVVFIDVILYGLFFFALGKTTPANASIVGLFEIVPSYLFFQILKKEKFKKKYVYGLILALIGVLIILFPKAGGVNLGDFIILFACFFPPLGNWYQQQARKMASTESVLLLRHLIALPFLYILTIIFKTPIGNYDISHVFWWLVLNGVLIFGLSKILWVEAIHRMTVTRALAINSLNPVLTVVFAWLLLNQAPTYVQLISLPFLIVSILLLTNFKFKRDSVSEINNELS